MMISAHRPAAINLDSWKAIGWVNGLFVFGVIFYSLIGIDPFPATDLSLERDSLVSARTADYTNRIAIVGLVALSLPIALMNFQKYLMTARNALIIFGPVCVLTIISAFWSLEITATLKRGIVMLLALQMVITLVVAAGSKKRFIALLVMAFLVRLALDYFGVIVIPERATHLIFDGAWRGILPHKNQTSHTLAIFHVILLSLFLARREVVVFWRSGILLGLAMIANLFFLSQTSGKSAMLLAGICTLLIVGMWITGNARVSSRSFGKFAIMGMGLFVPLLVALAVYEFGVTFTGRTFLWSILWKAFEGHEILGFGYNAIYSRSGGELLLQAGAFGFSATIGHGHNGYLDFLLSFGFLGIGVLFYTILAPFFLFAQPSSGGRIPSLGAPRLTNVLVMIILYVLLANVFETLLFIGDKWAFLFYCGSVLALFLPDELGLQDRKKPHASLKAVTA